MSQQTVEEIRNNDKSIKKWFNRLIEHRFIIRWKTDNRKDYKQYNLIKILNSGLK
jgi:hypothetical protein